MDFREYKYLVLSDLYRVTGDTGLGTLIRLIFQGEAFKFNFWLRTSAYTRGRRALKYTVYPFVKLSFTHQKYKLSISIPPETRIGPGFYIGHFGGIVVNRRTVIGKNCNISHGVTLGQANRGKTKGTPTLGDNVYIGPGAKIVGGIRIGNNVAIGANCVVTKDIPDDSVVVGIPGRVISQDGSEGYINKTDYENKLR